MREATVIAKLTLAFLLNTTNMLYMIMVAAATMSVHILCSANYASKGKRNTQHSPQYNMQDAVCAMQHVECDVRKRVSVANVGAGFPMLERQPIVHRRIL